MTTMTNTMMRAHVGAGSDVIEKPSLSADTDLSVIAQHMYVLMMRNITSDGYIINDPTSGAASRPGCVIAAPSYPRHTPGVDQDYVFNWVRDAAIAAMELAAAHVPDAHVGGAQALLDYVGFARLCQQNPSPRSAMPVLPLTGSRGRGRSRATARRCKPLLLCAPTIGWTRPPGLSPTS